MMLSGVLALAACGGDGGEGDGPAAVPVVTFDALSKDLPEEMCRLAFACDCGRVGYVAACVDDIRGELNEMREDARARGLVYSAECGGEYTESLAEATSDLRVRRPQCELFVGSSPEGTDCDGDSECANGLTCEDVGTQHEDEYGYLVETYQCVPITRDAGEGEYCPSKWSCGSGLYCKSDADSPSSCHPVTPRGKVCRSWRECGVQASCVGYDFGSDEGVCGPYDQDPQDDVQQDPICEFF